MNKDHITNLNGELNTSYSFINLQINSFRSSIESTQINSRKIASYKFTFIEITKCDIHFQELNFNC